MSDVRSSGSCQVITKPFGISETVTLRGGPGFGPKNFFFLFLLMFCLCSRHFVGNETQQNKHIGKEQNQKKKRKKWGGKERKKKHELFVVDNKIKQSLQSIHLQSR